MTTAMDEDMTEVEPFTREESFEKAVEQEAGRLRVQEAAKEIVKSEQAAATWKEPESVGIATFLLKEPEEPSFHVEGLWPYGGQIVLEAPKKWGKSTLVRHAVRSMLTGERFLDRFEVTALAKRALVIDMELTERQFYDYWLGVGLTDEQMVKWQLRGSAATMAIRDPWVRREITRRMADEGADLVILDPLGPALRACGFAENSNDDVGKFLDLFDEIRADAGVTAALIPHHMGHNGEHSRGASVIGDKADAIWKGSFVRPGYTSGTRFLGAIGRKGVDLESTELGFDPATSEVFISPYARTRSVAAGMDKEDKAEREQRERVTRVMDALADKPKGFSSNKALIEHLGVTWNGKILSEIRGVLVDNGVIDKKGTGWHRKDVR